MRLKVPKNITQQAYELIRAGILRGELDPHRRLTEGYFAGRFRISKSPIREALNRLEAEGLIVIVPRRGAYVRDFAMADVEEIYELREILETWAVRHTELDQSAVSRLRENVSEAADCLRRNDREGYVRLDASFHRILAGSNPNSRLRKCLESMHDQMLMLRRRTFALSSHTSVKQHQGIVEALERGDRVGAARLMTRHIRAVRKRLLDEMSRPTSNGDAPDSRRTARRELRASRSRAARTQPEAVLAKGDAASNAP